VCLRLSLTCGSGHARLYLRLHIPAGFLPFFYSASPFSHYRFFLKLSPSIDDAHPNPLLDFASKEPNLRKPVVTVYEKEDA
jgi:hypothetical protein